MTKDRWIQFVKLLYKRFQQDEITALSAQMTYYLILSFFPFLIFLITLITYTPLLTEASLYPLSNILPQETYFLIMEVAMEVIYSRSLTLLSFGMVTSLWAASNGMGAILRGINKAYNQVDHRSIIGHRLLSLGLTIGFIIVLLTTFILLVLGRGWASRLFRLLGFSPYFLQVWDYIRYGISLLIMWLVFTALYRYGPHRPTSFREVLAGSTFAIIGWVGISLIFSFYVERFANFTYMYGSIGGVFVLLIWLYISSIILLLGAEINAVLSIEEF